MLLQPARCHLPSESDAAYVDKVLYLLLGLLPDPEHVCNHGCARYECVTTNFGGCTAIVYDSVVAHMEFAARREPPPLPKLIWENHSNRVSSFLFLPHGGNGAAITKKLEQKDRKLVLPVEEISIF